MKKITIIVTFLTTILLLASCVENEKDYTFYNEGVGAYIETGASISDEDLKAINNCVCEQNSYFTKTHTHHGIWENAMNEAFDEFEAACYSLDSLAIGAHIPSGAIYAIYLISNDQGLTAVSQYFYSSKKE